MSAAAIAEDQVGVAQTALRLRQVFVRALLVRLVVALVLHFGVASETFAPDQQAYDFFARLVSDNWAQDIGRPTAYLIPAGPNAYTYLTAAIYYFFGAYALLPKLLNVLVGAFVVRVVYDVAVRMGCTRTAGLRAATYAAFFPSLVLWSALAIRDVWIVLLILLICRQALILQARPAALALLSLGFAMWALVQFRPYVLYAVAGPVVISFYVQRSRHFGRNLIIGGIAGIALIYADQSVTQKRRVTLDFEKLNEFRHYNTQEAASAFEAADISTPGKALLFLPKGLAYFLLAPFPWMLGSLRQVLAMPETLFFYSLLPAVFRGVSLLARQHLRTSLMALLITAGLTVGYALGEGNAGTAYRHRAQILCFFLIFAAAGKDATRHAAARRSPALDS